MYCLHLNSNFISTVVIELEEAEVTVNEGDVQVAVCLSSPALLILDDMETPLMEIRISLSTRTTGDLPDTAEGRCVCVFICLHVCVYVSMVILL